MKHPEETLQEPSPELFGKSGDQVTLRPSHTTEPPPKEVWILLSCLPQGCAQG